MKSKPEALSVYKFLIKLFFFYLICLSKLECFSLDVTAPIFKQVISSEDNNQNYFGYSIAQHSTDNGKFLLVGAPQDSYKSFNQSGAIYKCPFNLNQIENDCEQIDVDFNSLKGDESNKKNYDTIIKEQFKGRKLDGQWFGVSLSSTINGSFSACAHKYVHYYDFSRRDEHMAYGACFTFSNDFIQEYKHVPCLIYTHQTGLYHANNYAYCQAGTSMLMTEGPNLGDRWDDSQDTFISYGMPSALNFRGLVGLRNSKQTEFLYGNSTKLCRQNPLTDLPGYRGQGYCNNLWEKYSYLGMSHVLINSYKNKETESLIAAGAPRDQLNGIIRFFVNTYDPQFGGAITKQLDTIIKGPVKGSYFGSSMAACDVNGDNIPDLIVGAPYYSPTTYEPNTGAIYIYLNHKIKGFSNEAAYVFNYTGQTRSLFGHSIACIGDIDHDGFNDFAVGAPYEVNKDNEIEDSSTGAVYIFRGHTEPNKIKLSQKIHAQNIESPKGQFLKGFGYSISGGVDMDNNDYPDLAVSALHSNAVMVLLSRPIVRIETTIQNNLTLQEIDPKRKECSYKLNDKTNDASCFPVEFCITLDSTKNNKEVNFSIIAEPESSHSRLFFSSSNSNNLNSSIRVDTAGGAQACTSVQLIFKKDTYDFITPINFLINYKFANENEKISTRVFKDINNFPVIHEDTNLFKFKANFKTECGSNNCLSDLHLHSSFVNLTVDSDNISILSFKESDSVSIKVRLDNYGELAYATEISVIFDERLDFIRKDDIIQNSFNCAQKKNQPSLDCKMSTELGGVPFRANHSIEFILTFSSTRLFRAPNTTNNPDVKFQLNVLTLSTDINKENNQVNIFARFKVRANLFLYGKRTPEQLFYGNSNNKDILSEIKGESAIQKLDEIGPIIEHTYKINNGGPFSVQSFQLIVDWPHETRLPQLNKDNIRHGKHLLYLIERPTKIPNNHPIDVKCSSYEVDPLKLNEKKLINKRSINEYEVIQKLSDKPTDRIAIIDCSNGKAFCQKIICNFNGDLRRDETISLKFTARVWNATLIEDYKDFGKVLIKSHGKLVLSNDIHDDSQQDNEHSVTTVAYSNINIKSEQTLPIWVYVTSVLIGLALLLLCTLAFWMVGFFERKKYGDEKYFEESEKTMRTPY